MRIAWIAPWVALLALWTTTAPAEVPALVHPAGLDSDSNRIADSLERHVERKLLRDEGQESIRVIVSLDHPPRDEDLDRLQQVGGQLTHVYRHALYGFAGTLPAERLNDLATSLAVGLVLIEPDLEGSGRLDDSMRQMRVRPLVWDTVGGYGLQGDSDTVIAIVDSGVDDTHTDLSGRVPCWQTFVPGDTSVTPIDPHGHGTAVAGTAAGSGASMGSGAVSVLTTTMSDLMPATPPDGYADMIKVPVLGSGQVTSNLTWTGTGTAQINLATSNGNWIFGVTGTSSPLVKSWGISAPDTYKARVGNEAGLGNMPFSMLTTYPYQAVGDGFNLFQGVAPQSHLAGLRVLDQNNSGFASWWIAAFDWLALNAASCDIKVANASINLNWDQELCTNESAALRAAANNVVANGVVLVVSAGNSYGQLGYCEISGTHVPIPIGDPALASKAITAGAINDFGAMTHYSSNGAGGSGKPDVVAPGGSMSWSTNVGTEITTADTNANDAHTTGFADRQADDYSNMHGTSFSAPHVSGLAALLAQDLSWGWSEFDAVEVKRRILATATETNKSGEDFNNPLLNRGARDLVEGYGRINADAAAEIALNLWESPPGGQVQNISVGSGAFDRQAWGASLSLLSPGDHEIDLVVPPTADLDLYIYAIGTPVDGELTIVYSSTSAGSGVDESITIPNGLVFVSYYMVVKRVSGSGVATLSVTTPLNGDFELANGSFEGGASPSDWSFETVNYDPVGNCNLTGDEKVMDSGRAFDGTQSFKGRIRIDCNPSGGDASKEYWALIKSDTGNTVNVPAGNLSPHRYVSFWANPETGLSCVAPGVNDCQFFTCQNTNDRNYDASHRLVVAFYDASGNLIPGLDGRVLADRHGAHCGHNCGNPDRCTQHVGENLNEPDVDSGHHWFRLGSEGINPGDAVEKQTVGGRDWYRYTVEIPDTVDTRGQDIRIGVGAGHWQNYTSIGETLLWVDQVCISNASGECFVAETSPGLGRVPTTIVLDKVSATQISIDWSADECGGEDDYGIYEGLLGNWTSHNQIDCYDDGGDFTETVTFGVGNRYYLVVPHVDGDEGSYGYDSDGVERSRGGSLCEPNQQIDCP